MGDQPYINRRINVKHRWCFWILKWTKDQGLSFKRPLLGTYPRPILELNRVYSVHFTSLDSHMSAYNTQGVQIEQLVVHTIYACFLNTWRAGTMPKAMVARHVFKKGPFILAAQQSWTEIQNWSGTTGATIPFSQHTPPTQYMLVWS